MKRIAFGGHPIFSMSGDPKHKLALPGFPRNDGGAARLPTLEGEFGKVQSQIALGRIQPMTSEATLGKNGTDLPVKINFSKHASPRPEDESEGEEKSLHVLHFGSLKHLDDVLISLAKRQRKTRVGKNIRREKKGSIVTLSVLRKPEPD